MKLLRTLVGFDDPEDLGCYPRVEGAGTWKAHMIAQIETAMIKTYGILTDVERAAAGYCHLVLYGKAGALMARKPHYEL